MQEADEGVGPGGGRRGALERVSSSACVVPSLTSVGHLPIQRVIFVAPHSIMALQPSPVLAILPVDILYGIIEQAGSFAELKTWCLVSRPLLLVAGPVLYEHVLIRKAERLIPFLTLLVRASPSSLLFLS